MVDRVTEFVVGETAKGIKNVTLSDDILHDHFPDYPVLPGAFIIEGMAQLSGFLVEMTFNKPDNVRRALLAQVEQAKFYNPVEPGDTMVMTTTLKETMDDAAKLQVVATVNDIKVAMAKLTFVLKELDSEKIHEQRKYLYKLWTKTCELKMEIL